MTIKGIDISVYQKGADFGKLKSKGIYQYVILRAGIAYSKDACFESFYTGAKLNGLPVGVYWFSKATNESMIDREVECLLNAIKGKQFEYPIYMDVELSAQFALGKSKLSELVRRFLSKVEAAGYWVGLYMSQSPLDSYIEDDIKTRYAIWVAQYAQNCTYKGQYGMWQYNVAGNKQWDIQRVGSVYGIPGECDMDYCYVDYPAQIKAKGLNGFPKSDTAKPEEPIESKDPKPPVEPTPTLKSIDEIAKEVIDGKWGNGTYRKTKLTKAGYDYAAVQRKVTEILNSTKLKSIDEIAKEVIAGKWGNGVMRKARLNAAGYDYNAVMKRVNELLR